MEDPSQLSDLEVPSEYDLSCEMDEVVRELRPNALAVLQFLREHIPHILAKWERSCIPTSKRTF